MSLLVGVWVARYLGPSQYGLFAYAHSYVLLFGTLATLGLQELVVRDVVLDKDQRGDILGTAFGLQVVAAIATMALSITVSYIFLDSDSMTRILVAIFAIGLLFDTTGIIEYWFQSQLQSQYTFIARTIPLAVITSLRVLLVWIKAPLPVFAVVTVLDGLIGGIVLVLLYRRSGESFRMWRFVLPRARRLLVQGYPLLLAAISVAIYMRIDQVMLKQLSGNEEAGLYAAATRISQSWYFVIVALASSMFPVITEAKRRSRRDYENKLVLDFRLLAGIAFAAAATLAFVAEPMMRAVYGTKFTGAGEILNIHVWAGIAVAMGLATSPWLLNEGLIQVKFQMTLGGAVLNVILNLILIPPYGGVGAAIATLVSYTFANVAWTLVDPRTKSAARLIVRSFVSPLRSPWRRPSPADPPAERVPASPQRETE